MIDQQALSDFVASGFEREIIPVLVDYIRIPNKSPMFDTNWVANGYMDQAVSLFETWAKPHIQAMPGASLEIVRLGNRTPVIFIEIPGAGAETVLLYGHLDKQPEMTAAVLMMAMRCFQPSPRLRPYRRKIFRTPAA